MKSVFSDSYRVLLRELIRARKSKNLTQAKLAKLLKRPQSFVSKYEHGERRIDLIEFLEISALLSIEPHEIISKLSKRD